MTRAPCSRTGRPGAAAAAAEHNAASLGGSVNNGLMMNNTSTGASTGTAARRSCEILNSRLQDENVDIRVPNNMNPPSSTTNNMLLASNNYNSSSNNIGSSNNSSNNIIRINPRQEGASPTVVLEEREMAGDGNCLFRSVSDQLYDSQDYHGIVRSGAVAYIRAEASFFSQYLTEDVETYCLRKEKDGEWGDDVELQALGEIYEVRIEIFDPEGNRILSFHEECDFDEGIDNSSRAAVVGVSGGNNIQNTTSSSSCSPGIITSVSGASMNCNNSSSSSSSSSASRAGRVDEGAGASRILMSGTSSSAVSGGGQNYSRGGRGVIRLMFRGGGHYNSLRISNFVPLLLQPNPGPGMMKQNHSALIIPPGEAEKRALNRLTLRSKEDLTALRQSRDVFEKLEKKKMEEALEVSRKEYDAEQDRALKKRLEEKVRKVNFFEPSERLCLSALANRFALLYGFSLPNWPYHGGTIPDFSRRRPLFSV